MFQISFVHIMIPMSWYVCVCASFYKHPSSCFIFQFINKLWVQINISHIRKSGIYLGLSILNEVYFFLCKHQSCTKFDGLYPVFSFTHRIYNIPIVSCKHRNSLNMLNESRYYELINNYYFHGKCLFLQQVRNLFKCCLFRCQLHMNEEEVAVIFFYDNRNVCMAQKKKVLCLFPVIHSTVVKFQTFKSSKSMQRTNIAP